MRARLLNIAVIGIIVAIFGFIIVGPAFGTLKGVAGCPVASSSALGCVEVDGTTITIASSGAISATSTGSGTVSSAASNSIAYYASNGTVVSGTTTIPSGVIYTSPIEVASAGPLGLGNATDGVGASVADCGGACVNVIIMTGGKSGSVPTIANSGGGATQSDLGFTIKAAPAAASSGLNGGGGTLIGGAGDTAGNGGGGNLLGGVAGATGTGGNVTAQGGAGGATSGNGGLASLTGGSGGANGAGGQASVTGGKGTGGSTGGVAAVTGGNTDATAGAAGGPANVVGGSAASNTTGVGGVVNITGGAGGSSTGNGGAVAIHGGATVGSTNGAVNINASFNGVTNICTGTCNAAVNIGTSTSDAGNIVLGNSSNTGKTQLAGLASSSAAQTGTVCLGASNVLTYDTTTTCLLSSRRWKQNINPLDVGLEEVMQLRPVSYELKPEFNPAGLGRQIGLIAEEVNDIDPRLVSLDDKGDPRGVRYAQMIALLTKAIQEQQKEIEELKARLH